MIETSIVIPTKNGAKDIGECLEAVYSQKDVGQVEVLVVDSGSTDNTLEVVQRYPVRLERIPPEMFHHARTRNYAAGLAMGEFLVFLSQDAIPASETWLGAMISNFSDRSVGAAYGRQLARPDSTLERQEALGVVYGEERVVKDPHGARECGFRYYHFSSVNAAIRKEVWQATRFPDDLKVFEDLGISKRILDAGWKIVYEPRATVYHSHNHGTGALFKRYFDGGVTWKRLGLWDDGTRSSMLKEFGQLLLKKLSLSGGNRAGRMGRASIRQDLAKSAGMFLGLHERFLPLALKRRLSAHRLFER
ncbi:MAG TPA: glycosyltransferase [Candidatus Polarisedimenticolia bacterium]|nr:glycosyltransferase [Candidatus Polarisedimenticolia bacterium]